MVSPSLASGLPGGGGAGVVVAGGGMHEAPGHLASHDSAQASQHPPTQRLLGLSCSGLVQSMAS